MKKVSFLIMLLLLLIGGIFAWWFTTTGPADSFDTKKVTFTVAPGETIREIANNLKEQRLINDPVAFFLLVKQQGIDNDIQAGDFQLSPAMSSAEIAQALQMGTFQSTITIPEGKRANEIADILKENQPSYQESWRQKLQQHEGYLFPDTYSLSKDASIDEIIQIMRENFETKYQEIPDVTTRNLSQKDAIIIASMVEREARYPEDRPLVASVIFNRLAIDMPLQLDATVQYALGYQPSEQTWWKQALTLNDLTFDSPYNTYVYPGLPPGPIANPGIDVITAVYQAPDTDYLYYISDSSGHNHYAKDLDEHNALIEKYGL